MNPTVDRFRMGGLRSHACALLMSKRPKNPGIPEDRPLLGQSSFHPERNSWAAEIRPSDVRDSSHSNHWLWTCLVKPAPAGRDSFSQRFAYRACLEIASPAASTRAARRRGASAAGELPICIGPCVTLLDDQVS